MATTRKKSAYTPTPEVPESVRDRYLAAMEVLQGTTSMTEAARRLDLSRERMHSLMNRALAGFVSALAPQTRGRPAMSDTERQLREELEQLRRENDRLRGQVDRTNRLLGVASEMLVGRMKPRATRQPRAKTTTTKEADDEPEQRLDEALVMRSCGVSARLCAAIAGVSPATLRRWCGRRRTDRPVREPRRGQGAHALSADTASCVRDLVHATHGQIGADALRHAVPGVSRRQAAALKRDTLTAVESARIARCERIVVHEPGIVRGFDAMYVMTTGGWRFLLVGRGRGRPIPDEHRRDELV